MSVISESHFIRSFSNTPQNNVGGKRSKQLMFPLVHLWVRAAAAVELHWEAQQVSDGPGPDPDDVRQLSSWQAPLPPNPSELLGSSFRKPEEVLGAFLKGSSRSGEAS